MTTAIVTGASGGIGEALARELASAGHDLVLVARSEDRLRALAAELSTRHGIAVEPIALDLSEPGAAATLATKLGSRPVDVLVNNAGFGDYGTFADADPEKLREMIQVNIAALTELTRAFLPGMIERKSGQVMNLGSTAAFLPGPLMAVYYATKAYVLSFGQALADEVKETGVTVTTVCPGPVASGFQGSAAMEDSKLVKGRRLMSAEKCARLAMQAMERGKPVAVLGLINKIQASAPRFVPRRLLPGIVRRAQSPKH